MNDKLKEKLTACALVLTIMGIPIADNLMQKEVDAVGVLPNTDDIKGIVERQLDEFKLSTDEVTKKLNGVILEIRNGEKAPEVNPGNNALPQGEVGAAPTTGDASAINQEEVKEDVKIDITKMTKEEKEAYLDTLRNKSELTEEESDFVIAYIAEQVNDSIKSLGDRFYYEYLIRRVGPLTREEMDWVQDYITRLPRIEHKEKHPYSYYLMLQREKQNGVELNDEDKKFMEEWEYREEFERKEKEEAKKRAEAVDINDVDRFTGAALEEYIDSLDDKTLDAYTEALAHKNELTENEKILLRKAAERKRVIEQVPDSKPEARVSEDGPAVREEKVSENPVQIPADATEITEAPVQEQTPPVINEEPAPSQEQINAQNERSAEASQNLINNIDGSETPNLDEPIKSKSM